MMTCKNNAYVNVWLFAKTNCVYTMWARATKWHKSMEPTKRQRGPQGNQDTSNVFSKNKSRMRKVPSKENM